MKLKKKTKIILIVVAVLVVLLLTWLLISVPSLIEPVLWTLLLLGIGFFALEYWSRAKKKKKQRAFDEKVSAKEGIEDRKREWQGWVDELEKQGIDRYELPFYLVVGEPQSGKSVLLQNSDLYFPFGQERLSGVGGTRGCDWWFTDEAVILDIAGRLFTHEGGVADKLEWESFLDQLNLFRPMSPANGVLLVIPCDALLEDSPEVCAEKANKIQSALLTLTQKLEAQLPVYLVLTKGDRIFGFAETVHRMDSEQRHQMFGWSREPDKAEQPFALEEAKSGFSRLVDRARLLRERMISTARLPEALPEIDRLYAFPDELAGMYGSLEIYLKRIFTESNLVDRASFRGIYLTSGLQTGAPIARVCAELLGDDRESDSRALEGLFSHQRAYFIKDLVRKRVFAERGLVRPTEGRVSSARRKAVIGYGAAGLLALAAVVGAVMHVWKGPDSSAKVTLENAIEAADRGSQATDVKTLLDSMGTMHRAMETERQLMEEVFGSTREAFTDLYVKLGKKALIPALRRELEEAVLKKIGQPGSLTNEPSSPEQAWEWIAAAQKLSGDVRFGNKDDRKLVDVFLPRAIGQVGGKNYTVQDALKNYGDGEWLSPTPPPGDRSRVVALAKRGRELLDGLLDPRKEWMVRGNMGYMIAWAGAEDAYGQISNPSRDLIQGEGLLEQCDLFANAVKQLDDTKLQDVTWADWRGEIKPLYQAWESLSLFLDPSAQVSWPGMISVLSDADLKFAANKGHTDYQTPSLFGGAFGLWLNKQLGEMEGDMTAGFKAKMNPVQGWIDCPEYEFCTNPPHANWTLKSVVGKLTAVDGSAERNELYVAKISELARELLRIRDWKAAQDKFYVDPEEAPVDGELDTELLAALAKISSELSLYDLKDGTPPQKGRESITTLILEHLDAVSLRWSEQKDPDADIEWDVVYSLKQLANSKSRASAKARRMVGKYLKPHQAKMQLEWEGADPHCSHTLDILDALNEHLRLLGAQSDDSLNLGADYQEWLDQVNEFLVLRLRGHKQDLQEHWRVNTESWTAMALPQVVAGVTAALGKGDVLTVIRADADERVGEPGVGGAGDRAKGNGWPSERARALVEGQPLASVDALKPVNELVTFFRGSVAPTSARVKNHPMSREMKSVLQKLEAAGVSDGAHMAKLAVSMTSLDTGAPDAKPVQDSPADIYVKSIYLGLRDRFVHEVRLRFLKELQELVKSPGTNLLDALYAGAGDLNEISQVKDREVMPKLASLLDPAGGLDALRDKYQMVAGTPMHPGTADQNAPAHDWWEFVDFLVSLQACLQGPEKETRISSVKFRVQMTPVQTSGDWGGAWADGPNRRLCNFSIKSGKGLVGKVAKYRNGGWVGMEDYPLEWGLRVGGRRQPVLWFIWTTNSSCEKQEHVGPKDLAFDLDGSLAPLLWCWSGDAGLRNDKGWLVKAWPKAVRLDSETDDQYADRRVKVEGELDLRETALRLKLLPFEKDSSKELPLPPRPAKPRSKL